MDHKKVSFGFSKINKKLNILPNLESLKSESKVELIKCLEGQEIKLIQEKAEEKPLIIPLKESQKTSAALASLIKRRAVLLGEEEQEQTNVKEQNTNTEKLLSNPNTEPEDIEKRAARELLAELEANGSADPSSSLVLPVVKPDDLPLEGAKESSLDDYDSIPVQDFGKAMLRGMGWSEPPKAANKGGPPIDETPMVRPKGMGLGADKALKKQPLLVAPESNEVLEVKRNAYVRILGGKNKDLYGQIEGFDDHAGRVIVKMAIGGAKETFNEFLCQPISRKEYAQYGKCINSTKYEEYKKKENEFGQIILKKEEIDEIDKSAKDKRKIKNESRDSLEKPWINYKNRDEEDRKRGSYKDDKKELKRANDRDNERHPKSEIDKTDKIKFEMNSDDEIYHRRDRVRENDKGRRRDKDRVDEKDRRRDKDRDDKKEDRRRDDEIYSKRERGKEDEKDRRSDKNRDDEISRNRERDRYESKYDDRNQRTQNYKFNRDTQSDHNKDKFRDRARDSKRDDRERDIYKDNRNDQRSPNRDNYAERTFKRSENVIQIEDSSNSDSDSHLSKYKSSKQSKKSTKKSAKSKKRNSVYKNDTSDSESSSDSSSEEEKRKKHKKKTKKSKKQRERSRSRGR